MQTASILERHIQISSNSDPEFIVSRVIIDFGIPPHIRGYAFIREAILLLIQDYSIINSVTKNIYPEIAKKYNKEIFLKAVITSNISQEEIEYLSSSTKEYNLELILQPITTKNIELIPTAKQLQQIQLGIEGVSRIIPQTHTYLGLI